MLAKLWTVWRCSTFFSSDRILLVKEFIETDLNMCPHAGKRN